MSEKLALFIMPTSTSLADARPITDWAESFPEAYIRVSEYVEVEFPMLNRQTYVEQQVGHLKDVKEKIRAEMQEKLNAVDELIKELSALPHLKE